MRVIGVRSKTADINLRALKYLRVCLSAHKNTKIQLKTHVSAHLQVPHCVLIYVVKVAGLFSKKKANYTIFFPPLFSFLFFKVLASFLVAGKEEKKKNLTKKSFSFLSDDLDFFPALTRPKFCA